MDESRENTVESAVHESLAAQREDPDSGVGVSFEVGAASCFVQWVRVADAPASLVALEIKSEGAEPPADALTSRGLTPHSQQDLAEIGMWEVLDPSSMSWTDEQQLVAALADLMRLLGARDGETFEVYP